MQLPVRLSVVDRVNRARPIREIAFVEVVEHDVYHEGTGAVLARGVLCPDQILAHRRTARREAVDAKLVLQRRGKPSLQCLASSGLASCL